MTFLAGNAAYVLHAGPGIRGGGAADVSSTLRRHAHFDELPSFKPIVAALAGAKQYLAARPRELDALRVGLADRPDSHGQRCVRGVQWVEFHRARSWRQTTDGCPCTEGCLDRCQTNFDRTNRESPEHVFR